MDFRNLKSNLAHITHYDLERHNAGKKRTWKEMNSNDGPIAKENFPLVKKCCSERCKLRGCVFLPLDHLRTIYEFFFYTTKDEKNLFRDLCMSYKPSANPGSRGEWSYEFPLKGVKYPVCKSFFCYVLDTSAQSIERIQKRILNGDFFPRNLQGNHQNRPNRTDPDDIELAKYHINHAYEFLTPHYGRSKHEEGKTFLPSYLTFDQIYHDFCSDYGSDKMGRTSFYNVFAKENVQIGLPPEDTCDVCFKAHLRLSACDDPVEAVRIRSAQEEHHSRVRQAREAFKFDVESTGPNVHVWSVDVQQTFQLPQLPVSSAWYMCKFKVHNFCIHDEKTEQGYMYIWTEVDAKKGANEIGSCLINHIDEHFAPLADQRERDYMSCDRNFGMIESKVRQRPVHTPIQLQTLIKSANKTRPFVVIAMTQENFKDMSIAKKAFTRPSTLKVTQSLSFEISKEFPNAIKSRETHQIDTNWQLHNVKGNCGCQDLHNVRVYLSLFRLKKNKVIALRKLMGFLTFSEQDYYKALLEATDDNDSEDDGLD
ncbi:unnamed protein product [Allacma fusca]|uniref:Uncharacterized protein n=1 Tax=Allacma fusca TaxID=39272 RepID=A0A8J2P4L9_9HEXA|nr:unnamed protein product [Allacma fusca]